MHHKSLIAIINFFNIILYSIIAMTLNFLLNEISKWISLIQIPMCNCVGIHDRKVLSIFKTECSGSNQTNSCFPPCLKSPAMGMTSFELIISYQSTENFTFIISVDVEQ